MNAEAILMLLYLFGSLVVIGLLGVFALFLIGTSIRWLLKEMKDET